MIFAPPIKVTLTQIVTLPQIVTLSQIVTLPKIVTLSQIVTLTQIVTPILASQKCDSNEWGQYLDFKLAKI